MSVIINEFEVVVEPPPRPTPAVPEPPDRERPPPAPAPHLLRALLEREEQRHRRLRAH